MPVQHAKKTKVAKKTKALPVCTAKDLRTSKKRRRKCVVKPKLASPSGPIAAPPVTTPSRDAFPTPSDVGHVSTVVLDTNGALPQQDAPAAATQPAANAATAPTTPSPSSAPTSATPRPTTPTPTTPRATTPAPTPATTPAPTTPRATTPTPTTPRATTPVPTTPAPSTPAPTTPTPTTPRATPAATTPAAATTPPASPQSTTPARVPVYTGTFGVEQAHRLLYRAGFGPKPGQAEALAAGGLAAAVNSLVSPGPVTMQGPAPTGNYLVGGDFAPEDRWGHPHLECLDRAVRSTDSLGERMTLVMHDWMPVSVLNGDQAHIWANLNMMRASWRGSFRQMLMNVTADPAMLQFLSGTSNAKGSPNENYARELMELFALGADRGAYTETDVREMARALTGFTFDWTQDEGWHNFRFDPNLHDDGTKTVFAGTPYAKTGRLGWQDAVNAIVDHPLHSSFVVLKLWSYFIPTAPSASTVTALEAVYRANGEALAPLVQAILMHPDLYTGPTMVKPPFVYTAGLMRARDQGMQEDAWIWMLSDAGQLIGWPPNVSGWNDRAWLNTATHKARWALGAEVLRQDAASPDSYTGRTGETPAQAVASALAFWGNPPITTDVLAAVQRVSKETWVWGEPNDQYWWMENFLASRQNAMRQIIATSPDFQVS